MVAPYLTGCYLVPERVPSPPAFPFDLPFLSTEFELTLDAPVTVLVGENGTGKSTLLESIAALCRLPAGGGGASEALVPAEASGAVLARALRPRFRARPRGGFFFRAETLYALANTLEERERDPDFLGEPYVAYGGKSLHMRSHGEAFLAVMEHRMRDGLFLFDEPEAALSPQRQLAFATLLDARVREDGVQVVMATHSPLLMTLPEAAVLSLDGGTIHAVDPRDTPHWRVLHAVLSNPAAFWREARRPSD